MPKTPDYFHNKTIVITGAASGIGRATALIYGPGKTLVVKADVTSREQVNDMVRRAIATFGRVEFLFNSAGAALRRAKFLEIDDDLLERTFALNLRGTFYGMQAVLPHMVERKAGVIVNVASMAHKRGGPGT